jgi:hypothetical protein
MGSRASLRVLPFRGRFPMYLETSVGAGKISSLNPYQSPPSNPYLSMTLGAGMRYNMSEHFFVDGSVGVNRLTRFMDSYSTSQMYAYSRLALGWRFGKPGN